MMSTTRNKRPAEAAAADDKSSKRVKRQEDDTTIAQGLCEFQRRVQTPKSWEDSPLWNRLNHRQQRAYHLLRLGKNVFVTGPGGSGKSLMVRSLPPLFRLLGRHVWVTAPTGTAAIQVLGSTLHHFMGLGLMSDPVEKLLKSVKRRETLQARWRKVDILVIDEISLIDRQFLEKVDFLLRVVRGCSHKPMGGISMLVVGDFFQLKPRNDFCFSSPVWRELNFEWITLRQNYRQASDVEFQGLLARIRRGHVRRVDLQRLRSRVVKPSVPELGKLRPMVLCSKNSEAHRINQQYYDRLSVERRRRRENVTEHEFPASIRRPPHASQKQIDRVDKLIQNGNVPLHLKLQVGVQVMLLVNLSVDEGLANGSFGTITGFLGSSPIVQFNNGLSRVILPHTWKYPIQEHQRKTAAQQAAAMDQLQITTSLDDAAADSDDDDDDTNDDYNKILVCQYPLRLAWAITIHKSQGLTLDAVQLAISNDFFSKGQAYTALSRCRSLKTLFLTHLHEPTLTQVDKSVREFYDHHHVRIRRDFISCGEHDGPVRRFLTHPRFDPNLLLMVFDACE